MSTTTVIKFFSLDCCAINVRLPRGCIPGRGEADGLHHCGFVPVLLVRTTKPRQTGISR